MQFHLLTKFAFKERFQNTSLFYLGVLGWNAVFHPLVGRLVGRAATDSGFRATVCKCLSTLASCENCVILEVATLGRFRVTICLGLCYSLPDSWNHFPNQSVLAVETEKSYK